MASQKIKVNNAQGFHMRPATLFVNTMNKYKSDVVLKVNGMDVNGKSLMNLIAACIKFGTEVEVECHGEDEQEALMEAIGLIQSGLGEE